MLPQWDLRTNVFNALLSQILPTPPKGPLQHCLNGSGHLAFLGLPGGWYVFTAELLHSKVPGLRNINYIHDILVTDSEHLTGTTFAERQALLSRLFPDAVEHVSGGYRVINPNTWLANNHTANFATMFKTISEKRNPEDEGLVLKNPTARLAFCLTATSNSAWQAKCRIPHKNYAF